MCIMCRIAFNTCHNTNMHILCASVQIVSFKKGSCAWIKNFRIQWDNYLLASINEELKKKSHAKVDCYMVINNSLFQSITALFLVSSIILKITSNLKWWYAIKCSFSYWYPLHSRIYIIVNIKLIKDTSETLINVTI